MKVLYTAVVFNNSETGYLFNKFESFISNSDFEILCHHMTINMRSADNGPAKDLVGKEFKVVFDSVAKNDKVIAAKVICDCPSNNETKHVTIAVNRKAGGKPFMSNSLTDWQPIEQFEIKGIVREVTN